MPHGNLFAKYTSLARRGWGKRVPKVARLQDPAARVRSARIVPQRVVVACQAVPRPQVQLPPGAAAAAAAARGRPRRVVPQKPAGDQRLGARVPAAWAAGGHLGGAQRANAHTTLM